MQQQLHQRLLCRARALAPLKSLPDALLTTLLCQSDPQPERVPQGVILFRQGEHVQCWYLLLVGQVQLYIIDQKQQQQQQQSRHYHQQLQQQQRMLHQQPEMLGAEQKLAIVGPGMLFGELQPAGQCWHSCSARVLKELEFVRIEQNHFLGLYNKCADQLQLCMLPMEDLTTASTSAAPAPPPPPMNGHVMMGSKAAHNMGSGGGDGRLLPRSPKLEERHRHRTHQHRQKHTSTKIADGIGGGEQQHVTMRNGRGGEVWHHRSRIGAGGLEEADNKEWREEKVGGRGEHSAGIRHARGKSKGRNEVNGEGAGLHLLELNGVGNDMGMSDERVHDAALLIGQRVIEQQQQQLLESVAAFPQYQQQQQWRQQQMQITGTQLCAQLHLLWVQSLGQAPPGPLVPLAIGQAMFDRAYLMPTNQMHRTHQHQPQFVNSPLATYHLVLPKSTTANGARLGGLHEEYNNNNNSNSSDTLPSPHTADALLLLLNVGMDSLMQLILRKSEDQRSEEELEIVFEELNHIRAFNHLSRGIKRGLARVVRWEGPEYAGTVIFREGEPANSWYVVLHGILEANANGKKSILREGDDFGKLALLNVGNEGMTNGNSSGGMNGSSYQQTGRRQATVVTARNGCQLLRVDATDFRRIWREVEADTVRLKGGEENWKGRRKPEEEGTAAGGEERDVLVLQRDKKGRHLLVAGFPENILEYVLETRAELCTHTTTRDRGIDELVQEVLFTQPLWMPTNRLCNALKLYFATGAVVATPDHRDGIGSGHNGINDNNVVEWYSSGNAAMAAAINSSSGGGVSARSAIIVDRAQLMAAKWRTVQFVCAWQATLGTHFFLDPVANSFVEELYSCLLEDLRANETNSAVNPLHSALAQMRSLMALREQAMQRLSRAPRLVLDCGAYTANAPAPTPVLPCDICNQAVLLADSSQLTLTIRLDQSATQIGRLARLGKQQSEQDANNLGQNGGHTTMAVDGMQQQQDGQEAADEECLLFELCPDGQKLAISARECSIPTMLSPGSILLAALRSECFRLPSIPRPTAAMSTLISSSSGHSSLVLLLGPDRLARAMAFFHFKLLSATFEMELLVHTVGREQFPSRMAPSNLDLLLRRFGQLQFWASTEVLLATDSAQRLAVFQALIQLVQQAKAHRDMLALSALCLGLSALPISRLDSLWSRLPKHAHQQLGQCQSLLWPARGHRNYRLFAQAIRPPFVPFVPFLLKELDFVHDGRPTKLGDGLISWEKIHQIGELLRSFRHAKGDNNNKSGGGEHPLAELLMEMSRSKQIQTDEVLVRNLNAIEDQKELMRISLEIQQSEK